MTTDARKHKQDLLYGTATHAQYADVADDVYSRHRTRAEQ